MGRGERLPGPLDDRVDRPGRQLDPEQLPRELGRVAARDAVAHGERHDRCLQPRAERRPRHPAGKLGPGRGARSRGSRQRVAGTRSRAPRSTAARRPGAATAPARRPAPAQRTHTRTSGTARASARSPRRLARAGSSRRLLPSCPGWPPRVRPEPGRRGRGSAEGGSCDGGSNELRELRFSRRYSSATRASSRRFASTRMYFCTLPLGVNGSSRGAVASDSQ